MDPRQKLRTVNYVADKEGFHPQLSDPLPDHPTDSEAVARAKDKHYALYAKIAQEHFEHPHPDGKLTLLFYLSFSFLWHRPGLVYLVKIGCGLWGSYLTIHN